MISFVLFSLSTYLIITADVSTCQLFDHSCVPDRSIKAGYPLRFWVDFDFDHFNFLADIIFWYLFSYLLVLTWDKIRERSKKYVHK